ncbi:hypothetical protein BDW62DRAFT_216767 [Aspergillus aurantiobrunneus]
MCDISSTEKKRLRDRRGQKKLREKRDSYIQSLERQVASCKQHHGTDRTGQLISIVNQLYRENQALRARHERLRALLMDDTALSNPPLSMRDIERTTFSGPDTRCAGLYQEPTVSLPPDGLPTEGDGHSSQLQAIEQQTAISAQVEEYPSATVPNPLQAGYELPPGSAWYLLPMSTTEANQRALPGTWSWFEHLDLVAACPTKPSPLDLLHGTRRNFLADEIHRSLRCRAIRDAECLALGWLLYNFSKWLATPDPTSFARLSPFQRPIAAQFQRDHPRAIDMVVWPQVRANLMKSWTTYDFVDLTGYMSCCTKLRWPWGKPILERDANDDLQMRQDYLDTFTNETAWGLTSEFIERYPDVLQGMDVEAVRFQLSLPNEEPEP